MPPTRDLPLLEVLAAAPDRRVPPEKIEPLALVLQAKGLLKTGQWLEVAPANGRPASARDLDDAFISAASYRAAFRTPDAYALTEDGGLYLHDLGVRVDAEAERVVADAVDRSVEELRIEAERLWRGIA